MAAPSKADVPKELYEFTKSFVASAEKSQKALEGPSSGAKLFSNIVGATPEICKAIGVPFPIPGKPIAAGVLYINEAFSQKINQYKIINSLPIDSSQCAQNVFKLVFISTAIEIYNTFEFQLHNVYLKVDGNKNNYSALQELGSYAGERCFKQLLRTGSPENLHRILVPSINSKNGYNNFEDEAKTNWESLLNLTDAKYDNFMSKISSKFIGKLCFSLNKTCEIETTLAKFFDKCIPGFLRNNPDILKKKPKIKCPSNAIFVDKEKKQNTKPDKYDLYIRPAFQIEAEKIEMDNLDTLEDVSLTNDKRKMNIFECKDCTDLTIQILEDINLDPSYNPLTALHNLSLKQDSKINKIESVVQEVELDVQEVKSDIQEVKSDVHEVKAGVMDLKSDANDLKSDVKDLKSGLNTLVSRSENSKEKKPPSRLRFQVPHPPETFVGRTNILAEIKKNVDDQKQRLTILSQTNIISGLGGVGKTTTAAEFIRIFEQDNPGCNVVFIHAETHESLKEDFTSLALKLKVLEDRKDFKWNTVQDDVYKRICDRKCLLVFDNAESLKNGIENYLPSLSPGETKNVSILVTTRNCEPKSWGNCKPIQLDVFKDDESTDFVKKMLIDNVEKDEDIRKLMTMCGNLPLALQLALTFIDQQPTFGYTVRQFLAEKKITSLVGKGNNPEKPNILYTLWDLNLANFSKFEKNGQLALFILRIMAFSDKPDMMDFDFLKKYFFQADTEEYLGEALKLLVKYSLISKFNSPDGRGTCFSIHRMVQMVTKEKMLESIEESSKFFVGLLSNLGLLKTYDNSCFRIKWLTKIILNKVGYDFGSEHAWNFAKEVVRTIMGKTNVDSDSKLLTDVHDITMDYLIPTDEFYPNRGLMFDKCMNAMFHKTEGYFWNFPSCLTGQSTSDLSLFQNFDKPLALPTLNTPTKYRLVFFASAGWEDFKRKANTLCAKKSIVTRAEKYFAKRGVVPNKVLSSKVGVKIEVEGSMALLTVFIEKVKKSTDSGVWYIHPGDKSVPHELSHCDWDGEDSHFVFLLLPSESNKMFCSLLKIIYDPDLSRSRKSCCFIGLNLLTQLFLKSNVENACGTIQFLLGFIGKGVKYFPDKGEAFCILDNSNYYSGKVLQTEKFKDEDEFIESFVSSASEALKSVEKLIGKDKSVFKPSKAIPNDVQPVALTTLSEEIWKHLSTFKSDNCPSIYSSQNFQNVFQKVFDTCAREIYSAFKLQLNEVYYKIGKNRDHSQALKKLGRYAGQRCFQQLLQTGSPENLHYILIPSVTKSSWYNFTVENTSWKVLQSVTDTKLINSTSLEKAIITNTQWVFYDSTIDNNRTQYRTTAAKFFDDCIPGFSHNCHSVMKSKLEEQNLSVTTDSINIIVGKAILKETKDKSNTKDLLRFPFKIEAEKINLDNLHLEYEYCFGKTGLLLRGSTFLGVIFDLDTLIERLFLETNWDSFLDNIPEISEKVDKFHMRFGLECTERILDNTLSNSKDAWDFATEIVKTILGEEHLDSARIMPYAYAVATKYVGILTHNIFKREKEIFDPKKTIRNLYFTEVEKQVLFLITETFADFEERAKALNLSQGTVELAKEFFATIGNMASDTKTPKVLLSVVIAKVKKSSKTRPRVWVVSPKSREKEDPEFKNCDWDEEDTQIAFFLFPSQYSAIFTLLLEEMFVYDPRCFFSNRFFRLRVLVFIGASILAQVILNVKDPNPIDTIHSLMAFIGRGEK